MHVSRGVHFPHGCINDRIPSSALLPSIQVFFIDFPLDLIELFLETFAILFLILKNSGVVMGNVDVEIPPMEFVDQVVVVT